MKLSEAVARSGWTLVVHPNPYLHPEGLGEGFLAMAARALPGGRVAAIADSWDYAFSVSHEMIEAQHNFTHSAEMFGDQANLLARWLKWATAPAATSGTVWLHGYAGDGY